MGPPTEKSHATMRLEPEKGEPDHVPSDASGFSLRMAIPKIWRGDITRFVFITAAAAPRRGTPQAQSRSSRGMTFLRRFLACSNPTARRRTTQMRKLAGQIQSADRSYQGHPGSPEKSPGERGRNGLLSRWAIHDQRPAARARQHSAQGRRNGRRGTLVGHRNVQSGWRWSARPALDEGDKAPDTLIDGRDYGIEELSIYMPLNYDQGIVADGRFRMNKVPRSHGSCLDPDRLK